ncbi:MAG: metallophosphoesterase [Clostridia bacterium]|nr:metallophosphoesterase [Clostridia bacterium]
MTKKHKKHILIKILAALIIICAAALLYSKYGLTVTRYEIASDRLPDSFDGFRIVQLSDLHGSEFGGDNERLVRAVSEEEPDIIVMTGDFIDENEMEIPEVETLVEKLVPIAPVYFISGNHDWAGGEIEELAEMLVSTVVTYLRNEYITLESEGQHIVLAGVEDPNGRADMIKPDELVDIINKEFPDSFIVLLGHRNYWIERYPDLEVDIIMCGHSHGGIVRLPGVGGLIGASGDLFPDYEAGLYTSGRYSMVVSRGLGNSVSAPRFLNTPEIVTLILNTK